MTTLRHPNIHPPLEIQVADDAVEAHLSAGWLLVEAPVPSPNDPEPTGEDHEQE